MYCKNCAEVLTDTDVTCPKCGFAAGTGIKYCGTCGEELPAGAAVCEMCGTAASPVPNAAQQAAAYQQQPQQAAAYQQPYAQQQPYQQPYAQQPYAQQQPYQQPYAQQPYAQPQQPYAQPQMYAATEQKSKVAAGLLGLFLGTLGVHNFYLGYTGKAVAQLLITLFTCGFGAMVTGIWALIEAIQILSGSINVDAKGIPLKD